MDRGLKTMLAFGVLLGGIAVGMLFRRPSSCAVPQQARPGSSLVLRKDKPHQPHGPLPQSSAAWIDPSAAPWPQLPSSGRPQPGLGSIEALQPPPALAPQYPAWNQPMPAAQPPSAGKLHAGGDHSGGSARTHQIVDGDSLTTLAARYLGDPNRYLEIYAANRDVLPSPDILPIGVELRIPLPAPDVSPAARPAPRQPRRPAP